MPNDVIEIENIITKDCRRVIHLMSNRELTEDALASFGAPAGIQAQVTKELGAWHLRAEWPYRGAIRIEAEGWPQVKVMVAWSFAGCANVTDALMQATSWYEGAFSQTPRYGFVRSMPRGVEEGREVGPLMVFAAEWMMEKCVVVGG